MSAPPGGVAAAEPIAGEGRDLLDAGRGIYRFDDLMVLKSSRMPAVHFEVGIIVNRSDETMLASPAPRPERPTTPRRPPHNRPLNSTASQTWC